MKRRVVFVVCANGRGHRVRCERVVARLRTLVLDVDVAFFDEGAVRFSTDAREYDSGDLARWHERCASWTALDDADLVVSDNLVAVLRRRPDAMLMGSFLWHDVLTRAHPGSTAIRDLAALDDELLRAHRPPMICVDLFAMPAVRELTRAHAVDLMVDDASPSASAPTASEDSSVGVLGGATGAADALLAEAALALAARHRVLRGDDAMRALNGGALAAALCRPGMGTITDCIAHRVPIVALAEPNPELSWNAARLESLGLGVAIDSPAGAVAAVARALDERAPIVDRMRRLPSTGILQAASIIAERLAA